MALFLRLLAEEDKDRILADLVLAAAEGNASAKNTFAVFPEELAALPSATFAYWAGARLSRLFTDANRLQSKDRRALAGLTTSDDFRFVRAWWEVAAATVATGTAATTPREYLEQTMRNRGWVYFAKGGEYSPYFTDMHLVVNWASNGSAIRNFEKSYIRNEDGYFQPGVTWPRRTTSGFGVSVRPRGTIFADKGPAAVFPAGQTLFALGLLFSRPYQQLIELRLAAGGETQSGTPARSYEVGIIRSMPWPEHTADDVAWYTERVGGIVRGVREQYQFEDEAAAVFVSPFHTKADTIRRTAAAWQRYWETRCVEMLRIAGDIDVKTAGLLGVAPDEREDVFGRDAKHLCDQPDVPLDENFDTVYQQDLHQTIRDELKEGGGNRQIAVKSFYVSRHLEVLAHVFDTNPACTVHRAAEKDLIPDRLDKEFADRILSYAVGCAFGRWDVRLATGVRTLPDLGDPFAPLSPCSPGMLVGADGLPATASPDGYPLQVNWDGLLVDADGQPDDIVRRVREVLELLWPDQSNDIEQEACGLLGVKSLREWFNNPNKFFKSHATRYTKSSRKAPIYWLLQTSNRAFGVWVYYPRLTRDTLPRVLNVVRQTRTGAERRLGELQKALAAERESLGQKQINERDGTIDLQAEFVAELTKFEEQLAPVIAWYEPDLNDGVVLTAAPLHELMPWDPATEAWENLTVAKEYPWSTVSAKMREKGLIK